MGAGSDDALESVLVQSFDIHGYEHLREIFVAGTPGRIAVALLFRSQNGEVDPGCIHQLYHRARDLLGALVIGPGTADPVEDLHFTVHFCHSLDPKSLSPVSAAAMA